MGFEASHRSNNNITVGWGLPTARLKFDDFLPSIMVAVTRNEMYQDWVATLDETGLLLGGLVGGLGISGPSACLKHLTSVSRRSTSIAWYSFWRLKRGNRGLVMRGHNFHHLTRRCPLGNVVNIVVLEQ